MWSAGSNPPRAGNSMQNKGFTLLEMLVVLALVGVLIAVVPPLVVNMLPGVQLREAAGSLVSGLRYSRNRAMMSGEESQLVIDLEAKSFSVTGQSRIAPLPETSQLDVVVAESEVDQASRVAGVRFFPDGSSTGGLIKLVQGDLAYHVGIDWLTGQVRMNETSAAQE